MSDVVLVKYRETLITTDAFSEKFLGQLRSAITQRNPSAGKFATPADVSPPFQLRLMEYLERPSDEEFIAFSKSTTGHLVSLMEKVPMATGGYLLFAEHDHIGEKYLLLLLLSSKAQASFTDNLDLAASFIIDLDHLRHAARIHELEVTENKAGVVQFVSRETTKGTADYFLNFIGCEPLTDSSEQGKLLHAALAQVCEKLEIDWDKARMTTHGYWRECRDQKKPMHLTAIANLIFPDGPEKVMELLGDEKWRLAGEFAPPPPKIMNKFVKFTFASKTLKLEFDKDAWMDNVAINKDSITIKHVPEELLVELRAAKDE